MGTLLFHYLPSASVTKEESKTTISHWPCAILMLTISPWNLSCGIDANGVDSTWFCVLFFSSPPKFQIYFSWVIILVYSREKSEVIHQKLILQPGDKAETESLTATTILTASHLDWVQFLEPNEKKKKNPHTVQGTDTPDTHWHTRHCHGCENLHSGVDTDSPCRKFVFWWTDTARPKVIPHKRAWQELTLHMKKPIFCKMLWCEQHMETKKNKKKNKQTNKKTKKNKKETKTETKYIFEAQINKK